MSPKTCAAAAPDVEWLPAAAVPECLALLQSTFEEFDGRRPALQDWFERRILRNPWQPALPGIGVGCRSDGRLVAFRAMFAQPFWIEGSQTVVAFAAHTAVHPDVQARRLGSALIAASRTAARVTGSTSAGVVTQKIYGRLGFHGVGGAQNDFYRCRVGLSAALSRRLGGAGRAMGAAIDTGWSLLSTARGAVRHWRTERLQSCGPEVDDLWRGVRSRESACLERSRRYLQWRVFDEPTCELRMTAVRDAHGVLRGLATWAVQPYSDEIRCAVLRDLLVPADDVEAQRAALSLLLQAWREEGFGWASIEVASPTLSRLWQDQGLEAVPSHGNRYHVHADPPLPRSVLDGWFRSALDGDYFDIGTQP